MHPMTPLDAAQAIIDARARATQGEWHYLPECDDKYKLAVQTDRVDYEVGYDGIEPLGIGQTCQGDCSDDFKFIALSATHAAAVAQEYIDAEVKIAAIREAFAQWESVRTSRDTDTPEWAELVALITALED